MEPSPTWNCLPQCIHENAEANTVVKLCMDYPTEISLLHVQTEDNQISLRICVVWWRYFRLRHEKSWEYQRRSFIFSQIHYIVFWLVLKACANAGARYFWHQQKSCLSCTLIESTGRPIVYVLNNFMALFDVIFIAAFFFWLI